MNSRGFLILLVAMVAAGGLSIQLRAPRTRMDDVRAVYAAVLRGVVLESDSRRAVVAQETYLGDIGWMGPQDYDEYPHDEAIPLLDLDPATIADYRAQPRGAFPSDLDLSIPIDRASVDALLTLTDSGWERFFERYPGSPGFAVFTPIGFNASRTEALLHVSRMMGYLYGRGHYVRLVRTSSGWQVAATELTWMS